MTTSSVTEEAKKSNLDIKLDFWIKHNKNVIFIGKHGVGKTAMVKEAFDRFGLKWRYFSAATMDPWVDFIGVPKEHQDKMAESFQVIKQLAGFEPKLAAQWIIANWKMDEEAAVRIIDYVNKAGDSVTYLDLVRPKDFADGNIQALFFDEFNRSPKKVRNAVMELLQFKSINGRSFPNLKIIWAAINPDDDEDNTYDVERLDPAQQDRFHVAVEVPYEPSGAFFKAKYGDRIAKAACAWWKELPDEEKDKVSPRRLDYALEIFTERGDMRDVIPMTSNVTKLKTALNTGPITERLEALMQKNVPEEARAFLANDNNYASAIKYIPESDTLCNYFLPLLPKERIAAEMSKNDKIANIVIKQSEKTPIFQDVCRNILAANTDNRLTKKIRRELTNNQSLAEAYQNSGGTGQDEAAKPHFNKAKAGWGTTLAQLTTAPKGSAPEIMTVFQKIVSDIPEQMTADEALQALTILSDTFGHRWTSTLASPGMEKLMPVVNHLLGEIHRHTKFTFGEIVGKHGHQFKNLLEKIRLAGLQTKLYQPK